MGIPIVQPEAKPCKVPFRVGPDMQSHMRSTLRKNAKPGRKKGSGRGRGRGGKKSRGNKTSEVDGQTTVAATGESTRGNGKTRQHVPKAEKGRWKSSGTTEEEMPKSTCKRKTIQNARSNPDQTTTPKKRRSRDPKATAATAEEQDKKESKPSSHSRKTPKAKESVEEKRYRIEKNANQKKRDKVKAWEEACGRSLGCGKCRMAWSGCLTCRDPAFTPPSESSSKRRKKPAPVDVD